jgi:hypothetical protein
VEVIGGERVSSEGCSGLSKCGRRWTERESGEREIEDACWLGLGLAEEEGLESFQLIPVHAGNPCGPALKTEFTWPENYENVTSMSLLQSRGITKASKFLGNGNGNGRTPRTLCIHHHTQP